MRRLLASWGLVLWLGSGAWALSSQVKDALQLELEGRLSEALELYRAALSSDSLLVQDEALAQADTVLVLSKAAHLSIDLGQGEEAWDLGGRLLASSNPRAREAGTLVRMRVLRLQGRWTEALDLYQVLVAWLAPQAPGPQVVAEAWRLRSLSRQLSTGLLALIEGRPGPAHWVVKGQWGAVVGPSEGLRLTVVEPVRLQVGAFQDWGHALTLIDMLREKGWVPFTSVKTGALGEKLHVVYIVSRQPESDRQRLEAQGLTSLP